MWHTRTTPLSSLLLVTTLAAAPLAAQVPVNLTPWTAQSYPAVNGFGAGNWVVAPDGNSVRQTVNGQPTIFASNFQAQGTEIQGRVRVNSANDDDFFGFALGYNIGDITNPQANYLLVDWKKGTQAFDFGAPSNTPGSTARSGLAVSRVTGIPTADEFWGHTNFAQDASGGLEELARAEDLGTTGWVVGTTYDFRFVFQPNLLQVFVNGALQINISGVFANGSMAFYNFSQADVTYSAFTVRQLEPANPDVVPEPETYALMATGMGLLGIVARRRRRAISAP